jgi:NTP pyrophosphatase (non-canonical NTP hydrolase)
VEAVKNAFINQKIMLVVSELSEMMEALRKSKNVECGDKILKELKEQFSENPKLFYMRFIHHVKDTFEDELADVMIRLGDLVGKLEVDIETHIDLKQKFNSLREEMYGKKF